MLKKYHKYLIISFIILYFILLFIPLGRFKIGEHEVYPLNGYQILFGYKDGNDKILKISPLLWIVIVLLFLIIYTGFFHFEYRKRNSSAFTIVLAVTYIDVPLCSYQYTKDLYYYFYPYPISYLVGGILVTLACLLLYIAIKDKENDAKKIIKEKKKKVAIEDVPIYEEEETKLIDDKTNKNEIVESNVIDV